MAIPAYPPDLPPPLREGFQETLPDGRLQTEMESGHVKGRRRVSSAPRPQAMTLSVAGGGVARFERFWTEETGGGVKPFSLPDPLRHRRPLTAAGRPLTVGGRPLLRTCVRVAKFGQAAPVITTTGARYRIAFPLLILR